MLNLESITKSFHDGESELHVLRGIDLELAPGESLALLGASGNGKSTLLQIAAGLESPDTGEVYILGKPVSGMSERELAMLRRRHLGFVFQQFNLLPGLSVSDNLLFQRRLNRLPPNDIWIDEISTVLGLGPLLQRPVEVLSSGQQQRVAIARALAHRPRVLFADEPTGNLDSATGGKIIDLLFALNQERDTTLVLVTHDDKLSVRCDRRILLQDGHIVRPPTDA